MRRGVVLLMLGLRLVLSPASAADLPPPKPASHQQPATSNHQPSSDSQPPTTNHQLLPPLPQPTTNNQQPATDNPQPPPLCLVATTPCPLFLLPEMGRLPEEGALEAATPGPELEEKFRVSWDGSASGTLANLDKTDFLDMSRWAKTEMASFSLAPDWWGKIPMAPLGLASDSRQWLFGGTPETSGVPLPSHSPLVFRRIVLFAWFDPVSARVTGVVATIRGWCEE